MQYDGEIIINTKINTDGFDDGTKTMEAGSHELEAVVRKIASSVEGLGEKTKNSLNKAVTAFAKQNNAYAQQKRKVDELKQKLQELSNQKVTTDEWNDIQSQIDKANTKINQLIDQQDKFLSNGGKTSSEAYQKRASEIETLKEEILECEKEQNQLLENGGAYKPVDTSGLTRQLEDAQNKLHLSGESLQNSVDGISSKIGSLIGKTSNAIGSGGRFAGTLNKIGSAAKSATSKIGVLVKSGISKLGSGLKNIASRAVQGAKALLGFGKNSSSGFKVGLKSIMKYAFGIKTLFVLIRKLKSFAKEGIDNFVQYDNQTNKSISSMMNSLSQLKGALGSAFSPIINAVAPIVTRFIGLITKAVNIIGQFFAALTGKSTYKLAQMGTENYAKSLDKSTKATKKANKENKRYLSGLDEMARWDDNKSDSDSGSGGSSGGVGYDTVAIDKSISNLAEKLKKLIKSGDWKGLGVFISKQLENALNSIQWDKIQSKVNAVVSAITQVLNGIFSNLGLADAIGNTFAQALNTITGALNTFLTEFDFEQFGLFLGTGFQSLLDNIDWVGLGDVLANGLNGLKGIIDGFWEGYDVGSLATGLTTAINEVFTKTDWGGIASTISTSLMNLVDEIITFFNKIDWGAIADSIVDFFVGIDWFGLAEKVWELLYTALGNILKFLWKFLGSIFTKIWEYLKQEFSKAGGNIGTMLFNIITGLVKKLSNIPIKALGALITALGGNGKKVVSVIRKIRDSIINFFKNIPAFFKNIFSKAVSFVKSIFGTLKGFFKSVWSGIKTIFGSVGSFFKGIFTGAWKKVKSAFSSVKEFFGKVWEGIKSPFSGIAGWFKETFSKAWRKVKDVFSTGGKIFDGITEGILSTFKKVVKKIIDGINSVIRKPFNAINGMLNDIRKIKVLGVKPFSGLWGENPLDIPQIPTDWLGLAKGAVIPPRSEFLAVLGDQKHGNNLEAPEGLIRKIVREESGGGQNNYYQFDAHINRKVLFDEIIEEAKMRKRATGKNAFVGV